MTSTEFDICGYKGFPYIDMCTLHLTTFLINEYYYYCKLHKPMFF